jgi:serine/threonine-protein kinase
VPQGPNQQKRGNGIIIGVIVSAAVLLLGLTCFLIVAITNNGLGKLSNTTVATATATTATVPVPNFVNTKYTDALNTAQNLHLQLKETPKVDQAPNGTIIAQDPPAGTALPLNSTVNVTVSSGPAKITIPDVSNTIQQAALNKLQLAGFTNITPVHQINPTVAAGYVIGTNPPAGMSALPDDPITLIVSSGSGATATPTATPVTPTVTVTVTPTCTPIGTPTPPAC